MVTPTIVHESARFGSPLHMVTEGVYRTQILVKLPHTFYQDLWIQVPTVCTSSPAVPLVVRFREGEDILVEGIEAHQQTKFHEGLCDILVRYTRSAYFYIAGPTDIGVTNGL